MTTLLRPVGDGLRLLATLGKARISLLAALSAAMGHIVAAHGLGTGVIAPTLGTWLLALGASSLNQVQERSSDARMARTRSRPLPAGRLRPSTAMAIAFVEILLGQGVLLLTGELASWGLGLLAVVWYNAVYTPLKRRTAFAVLPGALIGSIPPVIGWTAASASIADPRILAIAFFFFVWQIPHFWLLQLRYGEEYRAAGFPSITRLLTPGQLGRIIFVWVLATGAASLLLPLYGTLRARPSWLVLAVAVGWLVVRSARAMLRDPLGAAHPRAFRDINVFALVVILVASADAILAGGIAG